MFIDGEMHRRACRCAQTYLTAAGAVSVTRTLYRARRGERAVATLERKVGIVEGYWTPLAARQGAMLVSHLTPRDAEQVLAALGHMQPSKSSLDRLPKALSARWEAQREAFETTVREAMRWGPRGGQAILTLRSLVQSRRYDHAWPLLARSYRTRVSCPDNVVPLRRANIH